MTRRAMLQVLAELNTTLLLEGGVTQMAQVNE